MAEGPTVEVSGEPEAAAASALASRLAARLDASGRARLAIPGGSALGALPAARRTLGKRWSRVALTWVDERCVPESSPESNRGAARRLGALEAPEPAVIVPLFEDGETPEAAVRRTREALARDFGNGLDVLLLGLGEDGHVASLFPGRPAPGPGPVAWVADSPKPPPSRITLTREMLATTCSAVLLATGVAKRDALERLLAGDPSLPACGLPGLHVVTDQEVDR